jgi:hypothetical protein
VLDRRDTLQHLLRIGAVSAPELVDGDIALAAQDSRNRVVRLERQGQSGFIVKQPKDVAQPDAATMWTEATLFWLSANDPDFAPLARWLPRFVHYDEPQRILTIEYVAPAVSLAEALLGPGVPPPVLAETGRALAALHGPVSAASAAAPSRRLFASLMPWVLTIGSAENRYMPVTAASSELLRALLSHPQGAASISRLRAVWRPEKIIHGDVKAANLLLLPDGGIRLIDWEIAGIGDPLWDLGGLVHSMLIPSPGSEPEPLERAQARARPLAESFWAAYAACGLAARPGTDAPSLMLAMAGARILQTCLESTHYGVATPGIKAMLDMAIALMSRPEEARARWTWPG